MDGDSRGGAALSVNAVSGKPIKFVGMGEKLEALEPFYPDRTASRILGEIFALRASKAAKVFPPGAGLEPFYLPRVLGESGASQAGKPSQWKLHIGALLPPQDGQQGLCVALP